MLYFYTSRCAKSISKPCLAFYVSSEECFRKILKKLLHVIFELQDNYFIFFSFRNRRNYFNIDTVI